MVAFMLWLVLLVLCWPLALAALVLFPLVWLLLLPLRLVGIVVGGVFALIARSGIPAGAAPGGAPLGRRAQSESAFRSRSSAARPRPS